MSDEKPTRKEKQRLRECVSRLLNAIDCGHVRNGEKETLALAVICHQAGFHDLVTELALRTRNGRKVLAQMNRMH